MMEAILGGLSKEQAVADRIKSRLESLNEELVKAKELNMEVLLCKTTSTRLCIENAEGCELVAIIKATL